MPFNSAAYKLYTSFCLGILFSALAFSYIIFANFTSNKLLEQNSIYRNGKTYKLCETRSCTQ